MVRRKWGPGNPLYDWQQRRGRKSTRRRARGGSVVRRYRGRGRRRGGGGGLMSMLIPAIAGYAGGQFISPMVPISIPYKNIAVGAGTAYLIRRNTKSALFGALGALIGPMLLGNIGAGGVTVGEQAPIYG